LDLSMARGTDGDGSNHTGHILPPFEMEVPVPENAPKTPWMVWPVLCLAVSHPPTSALGPFLWSAPTNVQKYINRVEKSLTRIHES
jgi:hypothetical protein